MFKEKLENLAATIRAIAKNNQIQIIFENNELSVFNNFEDVKLLNNYNDIDSLNNLRNICDCYASILLYHDSIIHNQVAPNNINKKNFFDLLEQLRCEILLAKKFMGVRYNLQNLWKIYLGNLDGLKIEDPRLLITYILNKAQLYEDKYNIDFNDKVENFINEMLLCINSQAQYSGITLKLIDIIIHDSKNVIKQDVAQETEGLEPEYRSSEENKLHDENNELDTDIAFTEAESRDSEIKNKKVEGRQIAENNILDIQNNPAMIYRNKEYFVHDYKIYTNKYDEVIKAEKLVSSQEIKSLRIQLENNIHKIDAVTRKLSVKLKNLLQARQEIYWEYNTEEGIINSSKISNLIINPLQNNIYKKRILATNNNTIVSLLIDNSGSMRGKPITIATLCADLLAKTLDLCGVKTEILGFTTIDWKGGQSKKDWISSGSKNAPGRLNDLRHIIYKSADQSWLRCKNNLSVMLKSDILKENIDGEALIWSYNRILKRPESRKIIIVISDGAPVDDSTISHNHGHYLDNHLSEVVNLIEAKNDVELTAIGIGHDVGNYYSRATTIKDVEYLGKILFSELIKLFSL